MIELKNILKGLREQKQVSMDKMCEDLNNLYDVALAKSTISKWENGRAEPSLAYARILTKYFNITLDYLLGLEKKELYSFDNRLSKAEEMLLSDYNKLNALGKLEANKRVTELTMIPTYTEIKNNVTELITATNEELIGRAAHNDFTNDEEQQKLMKEDLDEL